MNWHERNYWEIDYFQDVVKSLRDSDFIDYETNVHPLVQVGVWIVERVDLVLQDVNEEAALSELENTALEALKLAFQMHPELVSYHIECSLGVFDYSGVLKSNQSDLRQFWGWLYSTAKDGLWAKGLARHILLDGDFGEKIKEVKIYSERGLSDGDIYNKIVQDSHGLNRAIISADSLVELGVLSQ